MQPNKEKYYSFGYDPNNGKWYASYFVFGVYNPNKPPGLLQAGSSGRCDTEEEALQFLLDAEVYPIDSRKVSKPLLVKLHQNMMRKHK